MAAQLESLFQQWPPIYCFSSDEIMETIKNLNPKKASEFDFVTGRLLKELPRKAIMFLTAIFNAVIRIGYYPIQRKTTQIMMLVYQQRKSHHTNQSI
jgi:hypothetical protein